MANGEKLCEKFLAQQSSAPLPSCEKLFMRAKKSFRPELDGPVVWLDRRQLLLFLTQIASSLFPGLGLHIHLH